MEILLGFFLSSVKSNMGEGIGGGHLSGAYLFCMVRAVDCWEGMVRFGAWDCVFGQDSLLFADLAFLASLLTKSPLYLIF